MDLYLCKGATRTLADGALRALMAVVTSLLEKNPPRPSQRGERSFSSVILGISLARSR